MTKPPLFRLSDHRGASDSTSVQIKRDIRSVYDHVPPNRRVHVAIRGAFHYTFSDDGALLKSRILHGVLRAIGKLGISPRRQLAVTTYCVHTFFDHYLKGTSSSRLNISSPLYPEIEALE